MIRVLRHGNLITVVNPVDGSETQMRNIIFVEEGRSGGDYGMSGSTAFLNKVTGQDTGLQMLRTHTHPVRIDKVNFFPVGKTYDGHINRSMHSSPQMRQQEGVDSRMVNGRPTYFKTWIGDKPLEDTDERLSNETLVKSNPEAFWNTRHGAAKVIINEFVVNPAPEREQKEELTEPL
jgi:hypothetical protein